MKKNAGEALEAVVRELEREKLPPGFSIRSRKRVFNAEGVQLAEFDLIVEGPIGSSTCRWLIECRDRPSDGKAEGGWIDRLAKRRDRFGFDMVTAVSTTGFSPDAVDAAEYSNVRLRTVESIAPDAVREWFQLRTARAVFRVGDLQAAEVLVPEGLPRERKDWVWANLGKTNLEQPVLVAKRDRAPRSTKQAWQGILNQRPDLFAGIDPGEPPTPVKVRAEFRNPDDRFCLHTPFGDVPVLAVVFTADLRVEERELSFGEVMSYVDSLDDETVAQVVTLPFWIAGKEAEIHFYNFGENKRTKISLHVAPEKGRT